MRIAIVGSREYPDLRHVKKYVSELPDGTVVISGGAVGVDRTAVYFARQRGFETVVHLPDWNTHGRSAGIIRNQKIVDDCDELVAFWDGVSNGTADSIKRARKAGKPTTVHGLDV